MAGNQIKAETRKVIGKQVKGLRRAGRVPAVIYGAGLQPTPIELKAREAEKALARATGATLFDLELDGGRTRSVRGPRPPSEGMYATPIKVAGSADPPVPSGIGSPGVKTLGVRWSPGCRRSWSRPCWDLPDRALVSIEGRKIDDKITVGNLELGQGVRILTSADDVVARVIYQVAEVVEEVKEVVAVVAEPEVIARKKDEDEEAEEDE
jgi:large subunit ribosomal protein L25